MVKALSEDLKWRIIYLWNEGFSAKHISRLLYMNKSTVYRIIKYYKLWSNVNDIKEREPGRKKIFNNSDMRVCIYLFY
jgi:DNA invertase Pin-like site-specific DNA recombinase